MMPDPPPLALRRGAVVWAAWSRLAHWGLTTRWVVVTLVVVNLAAAVPGFILWYGPDVLAAPWYLWPFVPDSPLSAALFALAAVLFHLGRPRQALGMIAITGCIKYGLWTDWYWFVNRLAGVPYDFEAVHLSLSHFGMAVQGVAAIPVVRPRMRHALVVTAWFVVNDFVDFVLGYHPRVPDPAQLPADRAFSLALTVILCVFWLVWAWRRGRSRTPAP